MKRIAVGALAATALLIVVSASAGALKTKSASTTIAGGGDGSATAQCKKGSEAVSGGFAGPGFVLPFDSVAGPAIFTFESRRDGKRGVLASAHNSGADPGTLITHAYCDSEKPRLKTLSASSATLDFLDHDSATAKCKKGSEAVWGGFDSPDLSIGSSREGKRKWTASAVNFNDPAPLTVYVYCDKSEPGLKTKAKSTTIGHDQIGTATAKCKRGSEAVSGGYFAPGGFDLDVGSEIYFYESHRKGKRKWTASGLNQGDPAKLTAFAYCEKK
jgi:hypothetical protein